MRLLVKRMVFSTLLINLVVVSNYVYADTSIQLEEDFIIPDEFFITYKCISFKNLAKNEPSLSELTQKLEISCINYQQKKIDGEQWLREITPLEQKLNEKNKVFISSQPSQQVTRRQSSQQNGGEIDTSVQTTTQVGEINQDSVQTTTQEGNNNASAQSAQNVVLSPEPPAKPPSDQFGIGNASVNRNTQDARIHRDRELLDDRRESIAKVYNLRPSSQSLPRGYKAYTLFLVPDTNWREKQGDLQTLYKKFKDFGEAIGNRAAAVWFSRNSINDVDVERSRFYCDQLNLDYNSGPYIVTISKRPDSIKDEKEVSVIKLSNITMSKITPILNILEQDIRKEQTIRNRSLLFEEIKQRLLTFAQRFEIEFSIGIVTIKPNKN